MRIISKGLFLGFVAGFLVQNASGVMPDPNEDHFQTIPQRNVFGLKEPAKVIVSDSPPQLPKIILTGITTILGRKLALLKVRPLGPAGVAADASKEISLILTEGQREAEVEVLQIDERAGSVRVKNTGTIMTLTFEKDGPRLPSTSAGVGPGIPLTLPATTGIPSSSVVAPALVATPVAANTNPGIRSFPSRRAGWPATANTSSTPESTTPLTQGPRILPGAPAAAPANSLPPVPGDLLQGLTPEEQSIVQQFQRASQNQPSSLQK